MIIDSTQDYIAELKHTAALAELIQAIREVQGSAIAAKSEGRLEREDITDLGALNDAIANLEYTKKNIDADLANYEAENDYGKQRVAG